MAGGTAGAAGTTPPPPPPCDTKPRKALPYAIEVDFKVAHVLTNGSVASWMNIANPTCDATTFPPFGTPDGGDDGGTDAADEAGTDGGADAGDTSDDTLTLALNDDAGSDAADGGVDAPADAPADAPVDAPATDGGTDAATANVPACYEFAYNPTNCMGTCWSGVIFQTTDTDLRNNGPGVCIDYGATMITFKARASKNPARVKFGSIREGLMSTEFYLMITDQWQTYTVSIPGGEQYDLSSNDPGGGVWNGFSVVTEMQDWIGGGYILVKDITWTK
jgi:hypothetical protein